LKLLIALLVIISVSCSSNMKRKNAKLKLRILHTNDHHGHYLQDKYGQAGMSARKTLIDELRTNVVSDGGSHLLLSGGDINTGTMESDIFDAEPDFLGMKYIGYDAMAVGNHEFDNKYEVLLKQKKLAGFPFLAANIFWKGTNHRVFDPLYIVREFNGIKVGVFGLTTVDTPFKASSDDAKKKFEFRSIIESAKVAVKELKTKEKVDIIIAVTHIGHYGSATSNGDIDLAKAVDGIDVIVGGHSQEIINAEEHNNTIIIQAEEWGKYVGVLDLYIDKTNKRADFEYSLEPVNLKKKVAGKRVLIKKEIKIDQTLESVFKTYKLKADIIGKKVVGSLKTELSGARTKVRSQQMGIGQFMGASLKHQVKGVDVVVLNGGSIRATLSKGKVTRKDIHNVHPYGNTISTVRLSPEEFYTYMETVAKQAVVDPKNLIGGYPQISGMQLFIKDGKVNKVIGVDSKWELSKINGKVISNKKGFTVGTMNFLAKGGDNYPVLVKHPTFIDSGFMINAAMMNMVESMKSVSTDKYEKAAKKAIQFVK
jgi:5'-nucleotidase/UDP-sugar diphosphatase